MKDESFCLFSDAAGLSIVDALICAVDPDTREILMANHLFCNVFGDDLTPENVRGHKCWEFLRPASEECSCSGCDASAQARGQSLCSEVIDGATGRVYRKTESRIPWADGRVVHLMSFNDATALGAVQARMSQEILQMDLLTNLSLTFADLDNFEMKLSGALALVGEFLGVDRVYILRDHPDKNEFTRSYIWLNPKVRENENLNSKNFKYSLKYEPDAPDYNSLCQEMPVFFSNLAELGEVPRKMWEGLGATGVLAAPLHFADALWGVLCLDVHVSRRVWTESDVRLAQSVGGMVSAALERSQISKDLYTAEETMRRMLDTVPSLIFWQGPDLVIQGCNIQFSRFFGHMPKEILGRKCEEFFSAEQAEQMQLADEAVLSTLKPQSFEIIGPEQADGERSCFSVLKTPVMGSMSELSYILGVMQNVTERERRKRYEQELLARDKMLEEAIREAEESNRAKTDFLSRMSHEIRTPMNAIIGMTRIAAGTEDLPRIKTCLKKIDASSEQLMRIINDILDISKISANKMVMSAEEFNLESMLLDVCNLVSIRSDEKRQNFHVYLDSKLPEDFIGDELHISQVLTNLLTNAIKFTPEEGSLTLDISLRYLENDRADLVFSVADTGIGISPDQQTRLFTSFEQADGGIARRYGGTGLGLAICKRLVELMGGQIQLTSELGKGSQFFFNLPLRVAEKPSSRMVLPDHTERGRLNLLIVDDCAETGQQFIGQMQELGIRAVHAPNSTVAIRKIQSAIAVGMPFNIVFMDAQMPDMHGMEAVQRINKRFGNQAIVLMSSLANWSQMAQEAAAVGIKQFVSKPLLPGMLRKVLYELLQSGGPAMEQITENVPADFSGKTILLAEDVDINREIVFALLENTHIEIVCAENGAEALELYRAAPEKFHMILMDVHMPRMNGLQATQAIRQSGLPCAATVPIVAMTASVFAEDVQTCLEAGMNDHLSKPLDDFFLLAKLEYFLGADYVPELPREEEQAIVNYMPFINVEEGMARARGNPKLFRMMLTGFPSHSIFQDMLASVQQNDNRKLVGQTTLLIALTSNLSLSALNQAAREMEGALKGGLYQAKHWEALDEAYVKTIEMIQLFLKTSGKEIIK